MGILTLSNFRDELTYYLEGRTITSTRLSRWINQAYTMVAYPSIHKHWELEAKIEIPLVANSFEYDLSTTASYITRELLGVRSARYVNSTTDDLTATPRVQLGARSIGYFNKLAHVTTDAGPRDFSIFRKKLFVTPGPTTATVGKLVVVEVWEQPTRLINDSDVTVLLDWWDEAILLGAKWLAEVALGFVEYAQQSQQNFASYIQLTPLRESTGSEDIETYFPDMNSGEPLMMGGTR